MEQHLYLVDKTTRLQERPEYSSDKEKDHSWFVGIANVDNPELVISVIIEQADGSAKAVNIAKKVFDAYYQ